LTTKDLLYVRIDKRKKIPEPCSCGARLQRKGDTRLFLRKETIILKDKKIFKQTPAFFARGQKAPSDIVNAETDEVLSRRHKKSLKAVIKKMELARITQIPVDGGGE